MTAPAERSAVRGAGRDRRGASDVLTAALLGGTAVWALISAAAGGGRPEGVLLAVLAVTAGYVCGRIGGSLVPVAVASVLAVVGLGWALASGQEAFGGTAVSAATPPGDTGAVTALLVLAAGAACCAAAATRRPALRSALLLLTLVITGVAALLGSVAGLVTVLGVLLCSLAAARTHHRVIALAGFALLTAVVAGLSWSVAERALPEGLSVSLEGQLTQHRVQLWQDAAGLAREHPLLGAGPDRFGDLSPAVAQSIDSDGKPHSAPLQLAAEQGVVGVALLAMVYGRLLYVLGRSPCSTPVVLTAGAALTALAALACVGNALSFTSVTAGAGLLAGLATARRAPGAPPPPPATGPRAWGDAETVRSARA
ncbi:O-antigen ligase family protein [Streptomyces sp. NPDC093109]|uniref:O-antigen ligase family protein n=1 Tax=Streptomyces sp. NPDC093109 TaxID=3154977 RepID=UPI00344E5634